MNKTIYAPEIIEKQFQAVPHELKILPNWVCFRIEPNPGGGKARKLPYQVNGVKASSTDPQTWTLYAKCVAAVARGDYDAIGFAFTGSVYMGFDFDDCLDPDTGILHEAAQEIVDRLHSYTEESVSGTGIHILMRGTLPEGGRNKSSRVLPGTEMYDTARFFIMTGEHWEGSPASIEARTLEIAELHAELFPPEPEREPAAPTNPNSLTDEELIRKASVSKGDKFNRLWTGDKSGYPSQSEADLALCSSLAFRTGNDAARIDSLFRRSGLYRKKWDQSYYRQKTIDHAICGTHTTYLDGSYAKPEASLVPPRPSPPTPAPEPVKDAVEKEATKDALGQQAEDILAMLDKQTLPSYALQKTTYLIEPEIPKGALILVTGKPNSGKSTLVFKWCVDMARAGRDILYLDRDNGLHGAREKVNRFGASSFPHIRYWGLWKY